MLRFIKHPVHVGLRQGCPVLLVLFISLMDRISRRSQGPGGVQNRNHMISLLFADGVGFINLLHVLSQFAAEYEAAAMRISTSKPWFRPGKGGFTLSGLVEKFYLKRSSSGISGSCSWVRERWRVRLTEGSVQPLRLWSRCTRPSWWRENINSV